MRKATHALLGVAMLIGCVKDVPDADAVEPDLMVFVSRGRAVDKAFRGGDGSLEPPQNCIKVPEFPTQLIVIARDAGGVRNVRIRTSVATIDSGTVAVSPPAPEANPSVKTDGSGSYLEVALTPAAEGSVRSEVLAVFDVDYDTSFGAFQQIGVSGAAVDHAGNRTVVPSFTVYTDRNSADCRGDLR